MTAPKLDDGRKLRGHLDRSWQAPDPFVSLRGRPHHLETVDPMLTLLTATKDIDISEAAVLTKFVLS
jgi:hypothetical protein